MDTNHTAIAIKTAALLLAITTAPGLARAESQAAPGVGQQEESGSPRDEPLRVRMRYGSSGTIAPLFSSAGDLHLYGGSDVHMGLQLGEGWAFYGEGRFGGYGGSSQSAVSQGALIAVGGGGDYTFDDCFYLGGGAGYAWTQEPSGPELNFRLGAYPVMSRDDSEARWGLRVGFDLRTFFVADTLYWAPGVTVGWEHF